MFIQTEDTPNPKTLKFIPGKIILDKGSLEFKTKEEAKKNILANLLFEDENVSSVFIGKDFITITKENDLEWDMVKPNLLSKIHDFFSLEKNVIKNPSSKKKNDNKTKYSKKDLGIVNQIKELLNERIKPAVAQDGGDISFVKFEKGIVFLELKGSCSGCPSSTITLKSGIENMLKYYIPEIESVEAVN